jgi:hypothetical protein
MDDGNRSEQINTANVGNFFRGIGNWFEDTFRPVGDWFSDTFGGAGDFFGDVGNFFGNIFEVLFTLMESAIHFLLNIGPLLEFVFFLINNFIDFIYGSIVFVKGLAEELIKAAPYFLDIINVLLDLVDYLLDLLKEYWNIALAFVMFIPAYLLLFFVIINVNSIF